MLLPLADGIASGRIRADVDADKKFNVFTPHDEWGYLQDHSTDLNLGAIGTRVSPRRSVLSA